MEKTEREPTTTELLNLIKLLESTLKFYANENNYGEKHYSPINLDRGTQARYSLDQLKTISEYEASLIDEIKKFSELIEEKEQSLEVSENLDAEQLKNFISQLKQINDSIKQ